MQNEKLQNIIERIERLEEERSALAADVRDVYTEAKSTGFDTKIIRKVIALRKKTKEERAEESALLDLYMKELGMLADTPLGQYAIERDTKAAK